MQVEDQVKEIIIKLLGIKPEEIKPQEKLYDNLGVDSTEMVEINIALEKAFGIKIDAKEVNKFSSVQDIAELIAKKKGQ